MTDKKDNDRLSIIEKSLTDINLSMSDIFLRLSIIESVLIDKNIVSQEEMKSQMEAVTAKVVQVVLQKANITKSIEEIVDDLRSENSKIKN